MKRLLRMLPRLGVVLATVGMAICARSPAAGDGWRTAFVLCALLAGGLVVWIWKAAAVSRAEVLCLAIFLRLIVFPLPPALSDDGYRYVWDGAIQAEEGINPYQYRPSDDALAGWHATPLYPRLNSADYYSVYPPLSQLAFAVGGLAYGFGWETSWWLIKLLFILGEGLGLWLLSRLVKPAALVLYAWHPLVVFEGAGQAHTEALAVGFLVLAIWGMRQRRTGLAAAALTAAGWVKLFPFVLLPFVWLRAERWGKLRVFGVAALVSGVIMVPYAASYVVPHIRESLDLYVRLFEFNTGPYYAIKGALRAATGEDWSKQIGPLLQVGYLILLAAVFFYDWISRLPLAVVLFIALGLFFATATTVHPWYLLVMLAFVPLLIERPVGRWFALGWLWLATISMATYWRYAGLSWGYDAAVAIGWGGWMAFTGLGMAKLLLPALMRYRARRKWRWIQSHLPVLGGSSQVLDLGAGEGFVGEAVHRDIGVSVTLADVVDFHEADLPFVLLDDSRLPFDDGAFDVTLLVFVLHHTEDAEAVLREARRITRGEIVVLESIYEGAWQHRLLDRLDRLANALRSGGLMAAQEEHLHFRADAEWKALFDRLDVMLVGEAHRGRWVHRQALYVLKPLLQ